MDTGERVDSGWPVPRAVFGTDRLLLTGDGVVLVPTSSSYRLESRGSDLRLLVVVGTRLDSGADPQGSEPHAVPVGGDEEAGRDGGVAGEEQPTEGGTSRTSRRRLRRRWTCRPMWRRP